MRAVWLTTGSSCRSVPSRALLTQGPRRLGPQLGQCVLRTQKGARVPELRIDIKSPSFAVSAAVVALLILAPVRSALGQVQISEAESAAKADAETGEGKKFGEALAQAFGREHGSTIQRCAKEAKRPDLSNFDLFLRLDETGVVDQAFVAPATALAMCVREKLPGWKRSTPPHAGFWVKVAVNLKSK